MSLYPMTAATYVASMDYPWFESHWWARTWWACPACGRRSEPTVGALPVSRVEERVRWDAEQEQFVSRRVTLGVQKDPFAFLDRRGCWWGAPVVVAALKHRWRCPRVKDPTDTRRRPSLRSMVHVEEVPAPGYDVLKEAARREKAIIEEYEGTAAAEREAVFTSASGRFHVGPAFMRARRRQRLVLARLLDEHQPVPQETAPEEVQA